MQSAKNDIERWLYRKNGRREYGVCLFVLVRARVVVQARKRIRNEIEEKEYSGNAIVL